MKIKLLTPLYVAALCVIVFGSGCSKKIQVGGACEYNEIPGKVEISSVSETDAIFNFIPDDKNVTYAFPDWKNQSVKESLNVFLPEGMTKGDIKINQPMPAVRMEIENGTCTPVLFRLIKK